MKLLLLLFLLLNLAKCELFKSSFKLCHLLFNELNYLDIIEKKIKGKENIEGIKQLLGEIRAQLPTSYFNQNKDYNDCLNEDSSVSRFITNPVNAYKIISRFSKEWAKFSSELRYFNESLIVEFSDNMVRLTPHELRGAQEGIYRLGQFYDLEPQHLISGLLNPEWSYYTTRWSPVPSPLSADDAFEIGKIAFNYNDFKNALKWLDVVHEMLKEESRPEDKDLLFETLDYLSWAQHEMGEDQLAYENCKIMTNIHPEIPRIQNNLYLFNSSRIFGGKKRETLMSDFVLKSLQDPEMTIKVKKALRDFKLKAGAYGDFERSLSHLLCRHEIIWPAEKNSLKEPLCFVKRGNNDFGKFITANVEKIYHDPDVMILRNIANDEDILHYKKLARTRLRTATVHNPITGKLERVDYRITQSSWFDINYDAFIKRLKVRLQVGTGLSLESSEDLQIANYGLGGYYDTHFDFATMDEPNYNDNLTVTKGGRLATFLLYMSNVAIGGRTGFQRLGISVAPSKGDAVFWFNLHPDLTGDARTRHIACPVVLGTKWVGNLWIRSKGEDRARPCELTPQDGI